MLQVSALHDYNVVEKKVKVLENLESVPWQAFQEQDWRYSGTSETSFVALQNVTLSPW